MYTWLLFIAALHNSLIHSNKYISIIYDVAPKLLPSSAIFAQYAFTANILTGDV